MEVLTTIGINVSTREKLKNLGKKGEKYNDIVLKLIIFYNNYSGKVMGAPPLSKDIEESLS